MQVIVKPTKTSRRPVGTSLNMPQMNKASKTSTNTNREELERELTADIIKRQTNTDTGRDSSGTTIAGSAVNNRSIRFETHQGIRRRHPLSALSDYAGVAQTNDTPRNEMEKALEQEHERVSLASVYKVQGEQSAVQLGLEHTAKENFKKKKNKLSTMMLASI